MADSDSFNFFTQNYKNTNTLTNTNTKAGSEKTVRQTSNKQTQTNNPTNTNTNTLIQKDIENIGKSDEDFTGVTSLIAFRISAVAKARYMSLSPRKKRIVKLGLETLIYALSGHKEDLNRVSRELGLELAKESIQPIVNINISESRAEAKAEAKIDITKLLDVINELEALLIQIQKNNFRKDLNCYLIPPARMKDLETRITALKELVN
ncbi:hypothetical protein [Sulfolobus spindle-shaped virus]|nr:hypothetical protein [Sulfolobus spindle-shaped virus]